MEQKRKISPISNKIQGKYSLYTKENFNFVNSSYLFTYETFYN